MGYIFDWVDAFTNRPFAGNACVVVQDADDLSPETRMALVRETSLSECAYLVKSDSADFGARYYLAGREIPMAGHPTVATVTALLHRGMIDADCSFTLEVGAGVLPITVRQGMVIMTQAKPAFMARFEPSEIAAIYGLSAADIIGTPQIVSTGTPFCITLLKDHAALRRAHLDIAALEAWRERTGMANAGMMEPFLTTLTGAETGDTFSRLLLPPPNPAEDPFTGSATGCMAAYLYREGHIAQRFHAEQGHWMGRPGTAEVEVIGPREAIQGVNVAGRGHVLMSGELHL